MQNVRRRPLSRRKCNYLRVHEIQNKSLLTVTTTPPFCATIPPVRSSSDTNYFMRQSGAHSLCSPLSSSAARKFTTSKALPFPVPSIVYNQASPPTACTNHRQPTGLLSCFILFPDSPAPSACAFSSGNSITAGLQACQMRFCSPILMHHDADGKELGEFSGFSNADFRGKMDDRGICDFSP